MKFIVKPNKKETKIINFDENKQVYIVEVKGKPINNEVNLELIKFLSKKYKTTNIKSQISSA